MKYLTVDILEEQAYIIPIGDCHIGDQGFTKKSEEKLIGYLDWVKERPEARIFLMGDILNVAGRQTKTNPFTVQKFRNKKSEDADDFSMNEIGKALELFEPYKNQIIGAIDGNHEERVFNEFGFSPMQLFCYKLDIPYCGYSALVRFKVGKRKDKGAGNRYKQNYFGYFHHTVGGGGTVGGKLNRVAKLRDIIEGVDFYCGAHNHQLAVAPQDIFYPSIQGGIQKRRMWYVDCGSFVEWNNSYAEKGQMAPAKLGSPRIRLDGTEHNHDTHISL